MKDRISLKLRWGSMLLDHMMMSFVIVLPSILFMKVASPFEVAVEYNLHQIFFFLMIAVYFNKDYFRGRSVAKRVLGLQIVDGKSGLPASGLQCLIRNLLIAIWPIEVLISIFSRERRLGDLLANTRLERTEKIKARTLFEDFKSITLKTFSWKTFIASILVVIALKYGMKYILP